MKNSQRNTNPIIPGDECISEVLRAVISFKLYLAEVAKSALLHCHAITHSLAVCAHVAPGS